MWITCDPWKRAPVEISSRDVEKAARSGDEKALLLNDEMRVQNRGAVCVMARPGDNLWELGLEMMRSIPDTYPECRPAWVMHEPGHA